MENSEGQQPDNNLKLEDTVKLQWEELKIRIEHYRYYLNIALQANAFFYVVAGAVLGFYLKGPNEQSPNNHLEYFLLLPILIGTVLGALFLYGALLQKEAANCIEATRTELNAVGLKIKEIPDVNFLQRLLVIFGCILFLASFSLILLPRIGASSHSIDIHSFTTIAGIVFGLGVISTLVVGIIKFHRMRNKAPINSDVK